MRRLYVSGGSAGGAVWGTWKCGEGIWELWQTCELCHGILKGMPYAGCSGLVIRETLAKVMICGGQHVECELFPESQLDVDVVWGERVELLSVVCGGRHGPGMDKRAISELETAPRSFAIPTQDDGNNDYVIDTDPVQ